MTWIKKHWPWMLTGAAGLIMFLDPSVQAYAGAHKDAGIIVATLWSIALHWAKSPRQ